MAVPIPTLEEHFEASGPKRILALDGGGVRGILSLGFLRQIESLLRSRHGNDPAFRLCHYFDLIAGTSTGSIIAALLAQGWSVEEVIIRYLDLADQVFARRWWDWRRGVLRPRYRPRELADLLRRTLGADCRLGDQDLLRTGLLVMCKRLDTGSPWALSNNPRGPYFHPKPNSPVVANRDYRLWQVVRASTAAPTFFQPERIQIASAGQRNQKAVSGTFVDGGVSPHNNPALQAFWLATLQGFGLRWPMGKDQLLIISVGTGRTPVRRQAGWIAAQQGVTALQSLMDDCAALVESLMQGMGHCLNPPRRIDPEVGTLSPHELVAEPRFSYARYDVKLHHDPNPRDHQDDEPYLNELALSERQLARMRQMDNPKPKHLLLRLGRAAAQGKVLAEHFPPAFDLPQRSPAPSGSPASPIALPTPAPPPPELAGDRKTYRKRKGTEVTAIRLNLDLDGFTYHKWGAQQTCKGGDWIVEHNGSVHTVDATTFARTYKQVGPATYVKQGVVWAAPARTDGAIPTLEGQTHYKQGDFLVWNDKDGKDGYAIRKDVFESLYELVPAGDQAEA